MEKLLDEIESYWSTRTEGYSEVNHKELAGTQKNAWLKVLTSQFPDKPKEEIRILDIGTGPGFFPVILAEAGYHVDAVDYTEGMLEKAKENAGDLCRNIRFLRMDAQKLDFEDNTFDVVISRNLTWNLEHPDVAYRECFSAGGIQAGEFLMHYDEDVNGTALDESYVPDALDAVPAHASAAGMIYSFYGRLSVGNMDPDWLAEGDLPPTFYVYGTEDPFYRQFQQQYDVIRNMGISAGRIVLNSWPHGFGSDGGWVNDYAAWLESVFANKEES